MKPEILTRSGNYWNFLEPETSLISPLDIAHALAFNCRFNGHVKVFYSVAQHCYEASYNVAPEFAYATLMHDSPESVTGDVTTPLKRLLPDYQVIEKANEVAFAKKFNYSFPLPPEVKVADRLMLAWEQKCFMPPHNDKWSEIEGIVIPLEAIQAMPAEVARMRWLARYTELSGDREIFRCR